MIYFTNIALPRDLNAVILSQSSLNHGSTQPGFAF